MRRLIACLAAGFLLSPAVAEAHTHLEGSDPEDGATVEAPEDIMFYFDGPIEDYNGVTVKDAEGNDVETADVSIEPEDQLNVTMEEPLEAGEYEASFDIVSEDGHIMEDSSSFTVEEAAEEETSEEEAATSNDNSSSENNAEGAEENADGETESAINEEEAGSGFGITIGVIGLGLVVAIVALFLFRLKRRT